MKQLSRQLAGDFIVLDLGSAHSEIIVQAGPEVCQAVTLIEVDALAKESGEKPTPFFRRVIVPHAVAGSSGARAFHVRRYPECSSFLQAKSELVKAYGLEAYFEEVKVLQFDCITLPQLLERHGIKRIDFLKTDLEGLDFEILSTSADFLPDSLIVQCELRFQPFFEGEGSFNEAANLLAAKGFELVSMRSNFWKYATPHRREHRDGRIVWADCIFLLREEIVRGRPDFWKAAAKQMILAKMIGLQNVAEFLFQRYSGVIPRAEQAELRAWLAPAPRIDWKLANLISRMPGGTQALGAARRFFRWGYEAASQFPDEVIAPPPAI